MHDLINFHAFEAGVGTAGQPTREQFQEIAGDGYNTVINLAMPDSDGALADEGRIVSSLGMSYIHLPVPFEAPTRNHLRRFFAIMNALSGDRVFVHCAVNARVSAFMFKYLTLCEGLDDEEATSPLLRQWLPQMDDRWRAIIELTADDLD